jgi:hypothetical protein
MSNCASCGKATARLYPSEGMVRWCGPCWVKPNPNQSTFDPTTVGSKTGWAGGRAKTGRQDQSDGFDLGVGYDQED